LWLPLWIVTTNDPTSIPFGLGILSFIVVFIGGVIILVGVAVRAIHGG
jgi:hypothetical protein